MDTKKWKSVAIRKEIVELAKEIGEKTERPISNVFAYAVKRLHLDLENYEGKSEPIEEFKNEKKWLLNARRRTLWWID